MADLRLFVAIELPTDILASLNEFQHDLQRDPALTRLRWVRPEGMHLTLKFLGAVPEDKRGDIERALQRTVTGIRQFESLKKRTPGVGFEVSDTVTAALALVGIVWADRCKRRATAGAGPSSHWSGRRCRAWRIVRTRRRASYWRRRWCPCRP